MSKYKLAELKALPTLAVGQADDLKIATSTMRVWLSRMTRADGAPFENVVTEEKLVDGRWKVTGTFLPDFDPCRTCGSITICDCEWEAKKDDDGFDPEMP